MDTVINVAAGALVMFVFVWVLIFGGIGALLANSRNGTSLTGMAWGAALGPIGWAAILWRTRSAAAGVARNPASDRMTAPVESLAAQPSGDSVHDY